MVSTFVITWGATPLSPSWGKRSYALPKLKILLRYPPVTMRHIWQLGWVNTSTGYIPFDLNEDRKTQCTLAQILTFDDTRNCFFYSNF